MQFAKGKLIAIGGAEDKGTDLETGRSNATTSIFLNWESYPVSLKKPAAPMAALK
jgi:hypothetical protein